MTANSEDPKSLPLEVMTVEQLINRCLDLETALLLATELNSRKDREIEALTYQKREAEDEVANQIITNESEIHHFAEMVDYMIGVTPTSTQAYLLLVTIGRAIGVIRNRAMRERLDKIQPSAAHLSENWNIPF